MLSSGLWNPSASYGGLNNDQTGMMDQFFDIKEQHPDTVLFFRMGDFYELFHDDAEIAADVLGLSLTSRDKNAEQPIPMAGFPWHGLEDHLRTMLRAGYITLSKKRNCGPVQNCSNVVTRVYTPGSSMRKGCSATNNRFWLPWCSDPTPWVWQSSTLQRARHGRPRTVASIVSCGCRTTCCVGSRVNW